YIELFEKITGEKFQKAETNQLENRIEKAINAYLSK
ncbi:MAG TPA: phosphoribosylaminoimidazolesuccinocarboxamide synthase, partial [Algoriphagus sp.]|nr:phosphoribosylaminoimidazolesuccinocarboxamide synthase [Algoriphagus sp.]